MEKERLEQERLEKERLEKERLEQERLEQERLEKERLEQERLEQERLEQERLEQERLEKDTSIKPTSTPKITSQSPRMATSEFVLFGVRIFVSRTHKRINIEDTHTGERWSLHHPTGNIQSDWHYPSQDHQHNLNHLHLKITIATDGVYLEQTEHGIGVYITL